MMNLCLGFFFFFCITPSFSSVLSLCRVNLLMFRSFTLKLRKWTKQLFRNTQNIFRGHEGTIPQHPNPQTVLQYSMLPLFSAKDEKTVTESKAELFIGYRDKADKQTPVSLGRKKQFQECKSEPMAILQQAPPPFLLDLRKGLQESKANDIM